MTRSSFCRNYFLNIAQKDFTNAFLRLSNWTHQKQQHWKNTSCRIMSAKTTNAIEKNMFEGMIVEHPARIVGETHAHRSAAVGTKVSHTRYFRGERAMMQEAHVKRPLQNIETRRLTCQCHSLACANPLVKGNRLADDVRKPPSMWQLLPPVLLGSPMTRSGRFMKCSLPTVKERVPAVPRGNTTGTALASKSP